MWECEVWEEIPYGVSMLMALEELIFDGCESLKMNLEGLRKTSKEDWRFWVPSLKLLGIEGASF